MRRFNTWEEITDIGPTAVALGNFDGVHKGHQELITRAVKNAGSAGLKSAVFTFSNHPKEVLSHAAPRSSATVKSILRADEKTRIIEELGVEYLFNMPFDDAIMRMSAVEFVHKLLLMKLKTREVYCGFNYKFGHKASGNPETLTREGLRHGLRIHVLEPYRVDGEIVSSSLIRERVEKGDVEACRRLMGRHYAISGKVVEGNRIGKTIGFPTSNLLIDESMATPANGVYITRCACGGARYPSVTNVGVKPTIGQFQKSVETHIFEFDRELYGQTIRVEFLRRTRDERKFESVEELTGQIARDCAMAQAYHRKNFT